MWPSRTWGVFGALGLRELRDDGIVGRPEQFLEFGVGYPGTELHHVPAVTAEVVHDRDRLRIPRADLGGFFLGGAAFDAHGAGRLLPDEREGLPTDLGDQHMITEGIGLLGPGQAKAIRDHVPDVRHLMPAASMPRSSFLRSAISSRKRAASSNCRSRAACIIWSVICWIRSASCARGIPETSLSTSIPELRTRSPCSGFLPRETLRPEPPTETVSESSASLYTRSRMSAIFLRSGCGSTPRSVL